VLELFFPARRIAHRRRLASDLLNCTSYSVNGVAVSWLVFGVIELFTCANISARAELPLWPRFPSPRRHRLHALLAAPGHTRGGSGRCTGGTTADRALLLSGIRASLPQNALYVLVSLGWALALHHFPRRSMAWALWRRASATDFMHTNLRLRAPGFERVVITRARTCFTTARRSPTPTTTAVLSVWDTCSAPWSDPERSPPVEQVGLTNPVHPLWQIAGL